MFRNEAGASIESGGPNTASYTGFQKTEQKTPSWSPSLEKELWSQDTFPGSSERELCPVFRNSDLAAMTRKLPTPRIMEFPSFNRQIPNHYLNTEVTQVETKALVTTVDRLNQQVMEGKHNNSSQPSPTLQPTNRHAETENIYGSINSHLNKCLLPILSSFDVVSGEPEETSWHLTTWPIKVRQEYTLIVNYTLLVDDNESYWNGSIEKRKRADCYFRLVQKVTRHLDGHSLCVKFSTQVLFCDGTRMFCCSLSATSAWSKFLQRAWAPSFSVLVLRDNGMMILNPIWMKSH